MLAPVSRMDYREEAAKRKGSQETPDCRLAGQQLGWRIGAGAGVERFLGAPAAPCCHVAGSGGSAAVYVTQPAVCRHLGCRSQDDCLVSVWQVGNLGPGEAHGSSTDE